MRYDLNFVFGIVVAIIICVIAYTLSQAFIERAVKPRREVWVPYAFPVVFLAVVQMILGAMNYVDDWFF